MKAGDATRRHRSVPACSRCRRMKKKCDRATPRCKCCVSAGAECTTNSRTTSVEVSRSIVQYMEERLAEIQHSQRPTPHGAVKRNDARRLSNSHALAVKIIALATKNLSSQITTRASDTEVNLPYHERLFYPSERPPLKIPVSGIYHDIIPRTAGAPCSAQFIRFDSTKIPTDVARRLFENYRDDILPRFPCFLEETLPSFLSHLFQIQETNQVGASFDGNVSDDENAAVQKFIVPMILAISSLTSKSPNFSMIAGLGEALLVEAMHHASTVFRNTSLPSLQCMLLLIQLGLMLPYSANLWFLTGEAMRIVVALGLHIEPDPEVVPDAKEAELRRRVFWVAYQLDRTVCIPGGCPMALSDEHITTQLPYGGGVSHKLADFSQHLCATKEHLKEMQFILHIQLRILQSEIHAIQFFDHPLPDESKNYDDWWHEIHQKIQSLAEAAKSLKHNLFHYGTSSMLWLESATLHCLVLLNRPSSRNLTVSESSLRTGVTAAVQLMGSYEDLAGTGGYLATYEIANSAFHAGIFLLYAIRNHFSDLQQSFSFDEPQLALQKLVGLLEKLSRQWPALQDTSAYIRELMETNLRNPPGHSGNAYDMNVLEELDCLVTQRRIHSMYHRNIPLPPSWPQDSAEPDKVRLAQHTAPSDSGSPAVFENESWWQEFIHDDFTAASGTLDPVAPSQMTGQRVNGIGDLENGEIIDAGALPVPIGTRHPGLMDDINVILDARPSCSFCRDRRVKCSRDMPSCRECKRTSRKCMIFDPVLGKNIPLEHIWSIAKRLGDLAGPQSITASSTHPEPIARTQRKFVLLPLISEDTVVPKSTHSIFFGQFSAFGSLRYFIDNNEITGLPGFLNQVVSSAAQPCQMDEAKPACFCHRPPHEVAARLMRVFLRSVNTFFPVIEQCMLDKVLQHEYNCNGVADHNHDHAHSTKVFLLVIAIGYKLSARQQPSFSYLADVYFFEAMSQTGLRHDHSSIWQNVALLQTSLLASLYVYFSPGSGDIWRYLGFCIRHVFDLLHAPTMESAEHQPLVSTLTRTLYTIESQVSIAFGRPSLLVIGDDIREDLKKPCTGTLMENISIELYIVSLQRMQIHCAILCQNKAVSARLSSTDKNSVVNLRSKLDIWVGRWKLLIDSAAVSGVDASQVEENSLAAWGSAIYSHSLFMLNYLRPTDVGGISAFSSLSHLCDSVVQSISKLVQYQQIFSRARSDLDGDSGVNIFYYPLGWSFSHMVLQIGLAMQAEIRATIARCSSLATHADGADTSQLSKSQESLRLCISTLLVLERDWDENLLTGQSLALEEMSTVK